MTRSLPGAALLLLAATQIVPPKALHAADTPAAGQQEFAKVCAKCHVEGGTGTFMLGRRLGKDKALLESRNDLPADFIRHVVRNGILGMPAITRVEVTDGELEAIVRYLTRSQRDSRARIRPERDSAPRQMPTSRESEVRPAPAA